MSFSLTICLSFVSSDLQSYEFISTFFIIVSIKFLCSILLFTVFCFIFNYFVNYFCLLSSKIWSLFSCLLLSAKIFILKMKPQLFPIASNNVYKFTFRIQQPITRIYWSIVIYTQVRTRTQIRTVLKFHFFIYYNYFDNEQKQ